jgi:hypothetical protein
LDALEHAEDLPIAETLTEAQASHVIGFLTDVPWGRVIRQKAYGEAGDEDSGDLGGDQTEDEGEGAADLDQTRERVRRSASGDSRIAAMFAFEIIDPRSDEAPALYRWQRLRPQFGMPVAG